MAFRIGELESHSFAHFSICSTQVPATRKALGSPWATKEGGVHEPQRAPAWYCCRSQGSVGLAHRHKGDVKGKTKE